MNKDFNPHNLKGHKGDVRNDDIAFPNSTNYAETSHSSNDSHSHHNDHHGHDHEANEHGGGHHHHHHGNFGEIFKNSLWLGIPILLMSPLMGLTEKGLITFPYSDIVVAVLATILLVYGGKPFFQGGLEEIKDKSPSMMALVSMGLIVSYVYSMYAVVANYLLDAQIMNFFFEFASLVLIMLLGHWIEMKALGEAGDAQQSLAELLPKDAQVILEDGSTKTKPVTELQPGDKVRVQAGENVPADGLIIQGQSQLNESLLTGESTPIEKRKGDQAIGGSTNGDSSIVIEVQEVGEKSFINQVQKLVGDAQSQPSRAEDLANKVASWLFWIALIAALISFIVWLTTVDLPTAVTFAVTTLVIACPHALGLAIPLVVSRATSLGANRGLLVKDREAYELTTKADVMILDKTGTLTTGEFKVLSTQVIDNAYSEKEFLALLAGIESGSSHPIAQSIVDYVRDQGVEPANFESSNVLSGKGMEGTYQGKTYQLLSMKAYEQELEVEVPTGATLSVLTLDGNAIGTVALGDDLKSSAKDFIKVLKDHNITPIMATGDNESAARGVAEDLGIKFHANMAPEDKYDLVENYKGQDKTTIMVGDGVNDAPSLALADVGIAVGAGTQVALDSADVILTQSEPGDIESFIELSFKTNRKMKQNLLWGAGYNFIAIPIAAGLLAPYGIMLTPAIGAVLMSLSTVIVAINAIFLRLED